MAGTTIMMWTSTIEPLKVHDALKVRILMDDSPASYDRILNAWENDASFRKFFNTLLADAKYSAFRWETPPVMSGSLNRPFEFVLMNSPGLADHPDEQAFAEHYSASGDSTVVTCPNLRGDATLIVPCPIASKSGYGHLASFVRNAPTSQLHELWQLVGATMRRRIQPKPVWLSTAGAGVSWLHIRLDNRPKYYGYAPYRELV